MHCNSQLENFMHLSCQQHKNITGKGWSFYVGLPKLGSTYQRRDI